MVAQASGVVGNERLTALAGAVLLVLMLVELVTTVRVGALLSLHVFVGAMLAGPLAIKIGSTGYRFVRYYARSTSYVHRGPPRLMLRLLAPLLVATTVILIGSGIGLLVVGPADTGPLEGIHNITFLIWLPILAIHVLAYVWRVPGLVADDWRKGQEGEAAAAIRVTGRGLRLGINGGALIAGAVAAIVLLPGAEPWASSGVLNQTIPAPVVVGVVLTGIALVVARPLRWR